MVYALVVTIELHEGCRDEWLALFTPLVEQVRQHEPYTLTYQLYTDPVNSNKMVIFERYENESDLAKHQESARFKAFHQGAPALMKVFEWQGYSETAPGFVTRQ